MRVQNSSVLGVGVGVGIGGGGGGGELELVFVILGEYCFCDYFYFHFFSYLNYEIPPSSISPLPLQSLIKRLHLLQIFQFFCSLNNEMLRLETKKKKKKKKKIRGRSKEIVLNDMGE